MKADNELANSKEWRSHVSFPDEEWRDCFSCQGYMISNYGRIRSLDRDVTLHNGEVRHYKGRILKQFMGTTGYLYVMCYYRGKRKVIIIHQEVARVFIGESNGLHVDHINSVKTDNRLSNLRYLTCHDNVARANIGKYRDHRLEKNTRARVLIGYINGSEVERFDCGKKMSLKYGINYSTLRNHLRKDGMILFNGVTYKFEQK